MKFSARASAATGLLGSAASQAQMQGVSKTEILVGTNQDLSGPITAFGKQSRNGMQLRVDEINEQGGSMVARSSCWLKMRATTPGARFSRRRSWSIKTRCF